MGLQHGQKHSGSVATGGVARSGPPIVGGKRALLHLGGRSNLPSVVDFSRASSRTQIDAAGNIGTLPSNVPATRDYRDGTPKLSMVGPATNLIVNAEATSSIWRDDGSTLTQLDGNYLGKFGGVLVASNGATWHRSDSLPYFGWTAGVTYTATYWYKAGSSGRARLNLRDNQVYFEARAYGTIGALIPMNNSIGDVTNVEEVHLGDGIYRTSYNFTPYADTTAAAMGIGPDSDTVGEDIIALGIQFEEGDFSSPFIHSEGAATDRDADLLTADISANDFSDGIWIACKNTTLDAINANGDRIFQAGEAGDRLISYYNTSTGAIEVKQWGGGVAQVTRGASYTLGDEVSFAAKFSADEFVFIEPDGTVNTVAGPLSYTEPDDFFLAASGVSGSNKPTSSSFEAVALLSGSTATAAVKNYLGF